jgi:hypothetical protein
LNKLSQQEAKNAGNSGTEEGIGNKSGLSRVADFPNVIVDLDRNA